MHREVTSKCGSYSLKPKSYLPWRFETSTQRFAQRVQIVGRGTSESPLQCWALNAKQDQRAWCTEDSMCKCRLKNSRDASKISKEETTVWISPLRPDILSSSNIKSTTQWIQPERKT